MSANTAIQSALNAHLAAMPDRPPTAWPNKTFSPPAGLYIRVDGIPRETDAPFLGDDSALDYGGIYQIRVMAPTGNYDTDALAMADAIQTHFARGPIGNGVRIRRVTIAPPIQDDTRYVIPVSIYYRAILSGA